jgi:hypothetical protein
MGSRNLKSFSIKVVASWTKLPVIMHTDKIDTQER